MVTRNDVAKRAGVSPAVVSYVMNNSNYVSDEKRAAVLTAATELGYYPNSLARNLKLGHSNQILLITDDIRNELFSEVAFYMEAVAYQKGYSFSISSSSQKEYDKLLDSLNSRQYAGVMIFSSTFPLQEEHIKKLNHLCITGCNIVLFMFSQTKYEIRPEISLIRTSIRESVSKAVDYLFEKGHMRIGYLGDGDPIAGGESGPFGDGLRINGYLDSLRSHNVVPRKEHIFFLDEFKYPSLEFMNIEGVVDAYFSLPEEDRPTAFFVNSDFLAAKLITRFRHHGIETPAQMEIIGFGNTSSASISYPNLTTVLLDKIAGNDVKTTFFDMQLIKGGSA